MNPYSRLIVLGLCVIGFGLAIVVLGLTTSDWVVGVLFGVPVLILGSVLLVTNLIGRARQPIPSENYPSPRRTSKNARRSPLLRVLAFVVPAWFAISLLISVVNGEWGYAAAYALFLAAILIARYVTSPARS